MSPLTGGIRFSCGWTAVDWHIADPGLCIAPGATKVTFYAWGTGFVSVGVGTAMMTDLMALTATPTLYTIDLTSSSYGYAGTPTATGFTVTFSSTYTGTVVNVDDIKWVR